MKPFQNPYVVGGLAVLALGLVFRNAIAPLWGRMVHRPEPVQTEAHAAVVIPPSAVPAKPVAVEAAVLKRPLVQPETNIDLTQVGWKLNSSPHRDPFQITPATITNLARLYPPAAELLALQAIWWQSGAILAFVNNRIVREGDTVYGTNSSLAFKISWIGAERISVDGPSGAEQVFFDRSAKIRGTSVKFSSATNPTNDAFGAVKNKLDWQFRVVNGKTNDIYRDEGWRPFSGKVVQKQEDGDYLISQPGVPQLFILKGVPLNKVDDEAFPYVICKEAGTKSYVDVTNAKRTVRLYDFGIPCDPPEAFVKNLKNQKDYLDRQYNDAIRRRIELEKKDATNGIASAQFMLGRRFLYGDGVPKDEIAARRWLDASAAQGNPDARAIIQSMLSRN